MSFCSLCYCPQSHLNHCDIRWRLSISTTGLQAPWSVPIRLCCHHSCLCSGSACVWPKFLGRKTEGKTLRLEAEDTRQGWEGGEKNRGSKFFCTSKVYITRVENGCWKWGGTRKAKARLCALVCSWLLCNFIQEPCS